MQKAKNLFLALLASLPLLAPLQAQAQLVSGAKRLDLGATPLTGEAAATGTVTAPSDLTAPKIPVAASATTVANSDLSYYVGKWHSCDPANGRKLCFTDSGGNTTCLVSMAGCVGQGLVIQKSAAEGAALGELIVSIIRPEAVYGATYVNVGDTSLFASSYAGTIPLGLLLGNSRNIGWGGDPENPNTQIKRDAAGQVGIYGAGSTYGQLNVGTIQLVDTGAKPTCDAAHRGQVWYDAGGAGVADTYEICRKDAADAYAWTALY